MSDNLEATIKFIQEVPLPPPGDFKVSNKTQASDLVSGGAVVNRGNLQVLTVRVAQPIHVIADVKYSGRCASTINCNGLPKTGFNVLT